ncbi:hypothetical protein HMPREF3220_02871 [Citrobacter koseri]|nr:hypothetical protein HMPREF3220_02871 [Citrobacter koseri]KXA04597.1 hypothetical protein HMPREF3207_01315 [Citrobacter koseri]
MPDSGVNALSGLRYYAFVGPVSAAPPGIIIAGWRRKRLIRPTVLRFCRPGKRSATGHYYCRMAA